MKNTIQNLRKPFVLSSPGFPPQETGFLGTPLTGGSMYNRTWLRGRLLLLFSLAAILLPSLGEAGEEEAILLELLLRQTGRELKVLASMEKGLALGLGKENVTLSEILQSEMADRWLLQHFPSAFERTFNEYDFTPAQKAALLDSQRFNALDTAARRSPERFLALYRKEALPLFSQWETSGMTQTEKALRDYLIRKELGAGKGEMETMSSEGEPLILRRSTPPAEPAKPAPPAEPAKPVATGPASPAQPAAAKEAEAQAALPSPTTVTPSEGVARGGEPQAPSTPAATTPPAQTRLPQLNPAERKALVKKAERLAADRGKRAKEKLQEFLESLRTTEELLALLKEGKSWLVRSEAASYLAKRKDGYNEVDDFLASLLTPKSAGDAMSAPRGSYESSGVIKNVIVALGLRWKGRGADCPYVNTLVAMLGDSRPSTVLSAVTALGHIGDPRTIGEIAKKLSHPEHYVRAGAARQLGKFGDATYLPQLKEARDREAALPTTEQSTKTLTAIDEAIRRLTEREGQSGAGEAGATPEPEPEEETPQPPAEEEEIIPQPAAPQAPSSASPTGAGGKEAITPPPTASPAATATPPSATTPSVSPVEFRKLLRYANKLGTGRIHRKDLEELLEPLTTEELAGILKFADRPLTQQKAAFYLGMRNDGYNEVDDLLATFLESTTSNDLLVGVINAIGKRWRERGADCPYATPLVDLLSDDRPAVIYAAIIALGRIGDRGTIAAVTGCLSHSSAYVRAVATKHLKKFGDAQVLPQLRAAREKEAALPAKQQSTNLLRTLDEAIRRLTEREGQSGAGEAGATPEPTSKEDEDEVLPESQPKPAPAATKAPESPRVSGESETEKPTLSERERREREKANQLLEEGIVNHDTALMAEALAAGADINGHTVEGMPFLFFAAGLKGKNSDHIFEFLLYKGADPDMTNGNGITAAMRAAMNGELEKLKLLKDAGANLYARDNDGKEAYDLAVEEEKYEVAEWLERQLGD